MLIPILASPQGLGQLSGDSLQTLGVARGAATSFFRSINTTFAGSKRGLIACLLIGTVSAVGFSLMGVRYALV